MHLDIEKSNETFETTYTLKISHRDLVSTKGVASCPLLKYLSLGGAISDKLSALQSLSKRIEDSFFLPGDKI